MASFTVTGFEDIEKMLLGESEKIKKVAPKMLKAGADVLVKAQKRQIENFGVVDTAELKNSIKATKPKSKNGTHTIEVYPQGKDSNGTKNAEKGFIAEYGNSKTPPRPWLSTAHEQSEQDVHNAMLEVWEAEK